jgi:hypothetical protein
MSSDPQAARAAADELLARIRATPHNGKVFQADDADYLMAIAAKLESGTAVALAGDWYRQMGLRVRATLAAVARLTRERDRLRAALDRVRDVLEANPCDVIHCDRPRGWSCYDSFTEARSGRGKYTDEFRARLAAGAHLCFSCQLRASMLAQPGDGAAGGGRG